MDAKTIIPDSFLTTVEHLATGTVVLTQVDAAGCSNVIMVPAQWLPTLIAELQSD